MDNPTVYIHGPKTSSIPDLESFEPCSNLDYAKEQCIKDAQTYHGGRIIYKLVPVFEANLEVTTKVLVKDFNEPPPAVADEAAGD